MHTGILLLHSYVRWVLLAVALVTLVRTSASKSQKLAWSKLDEQFSIALTGLADVQLTLGLIMWLFTSPLTQVAMKQGLLSGGTLTFFGLVHPVAMVIGIALLHLARVRLRKLPQTEVRHGHWRRAVGVFLVLVLASIPWPWLEWGRPLVHLP